MRTVILPLVAMLLAQAATAQSVANAPINAEEEGEPKLDPNEQYVPAKLDADGAKIVSGMNDFGAQLYGDLRSAPGDMAISPASISTAFGIAYAGARGRTALEIASTLDYPEVADFHASFGSLLRTMDLRRTGRTLSVNNALWLQERSPVQPDYEALIKRNYGAGLQRVDYKANPEDARKRINAWVESKTNGKIRNLLNSDNVTRRTRSVLVNTVYFKADWADPFDKSATRSEDFTLASGKRVKRDLMRQQGGYAIAEKPGLKVLAMPYRGGETEMVVVLPDAHDGLANLERSLNGTGLKRLLTELRDGGTQGRVDVTFPKFKIEKRFELDEALQRMGMVIPFSDDSDFSGAKVVKPLSPDEEDWNLKISDVIHRVFVEVEEKGTEAAAATAIASIIVTGAGPVRPPKVFKADHPFLFLIRDRRTDAILFIGRFTGESSS
jgi:serpin B